MHRSTRITIVAAAVLTAAGIVSAGESPYTGPTDSTTYVFCTAIRSQRVMPDESVRPGAIYYSGAFEVKAENLKATQQAYLAFLDTKYGFKPDEGEAMPVGCTGVRSLDEAKSVEKARIAKSREAKGEVVETGWTPTTPGS